MYIVQLLPPYQLVNLILLPLISTPELTSSENTLYILRLVIENQASGSAFPSEGKESAYDSRKLQAQAELLKSVLQTAQAEAGEWKLPYVKLWDPTPLVEELIRILGLENCKVDRDYEGIASLLWYGEDDGIEDSIEWIGNEKFAWC